MDTKKEGRGFGGERKRRIILCWKPHKNSLNRSSLWNFVKRELKINDVLKAPWRGTNCNAWSLVVKMWKHYLLYLFMDVRCDYLLQEKPKKIFLHRLKGRRLIKRYSLRYKKKIFLMKRNTRDN